MHVIHTNKPIPCLINDNIIGILITTPVIVAQKNVVQKMCDIFENNNKAIISITNDGPKGPRHVAKENSLKIAKKYNAQIITITGDSKKKWILNTWDKFYLPKPFGTITIHIAPPYEDNANDLVQGVSQYMTHHEKKVSQKI